MLFFAPVLQNFHEIQEISRTGAGINEQADACLLCSSCGGCSATVSASIQNTRTWGPRFLGNNLGF